MPLRHGTKAVGLLAAASPSLDIGTLDAVAGVVAIAIERAQFLAERDAAELVRQKADLAATLLASLSHDLRTPLTAIRVAVENLRGDCRAEERAAQAGAAHGRARSADAPVPGHPRHGAHRRRRDPRRPAMGRRRPTSSMPPSPTSGTRWTGTPLRVDADDDTEVEIDPRAGVGRAVAPARERGAVLAGGDREILVHARVQTRRAACHR